MSTKTSIEWTDHTFNIVWGCIEVDACCTNCYARTFAKRYGHDVWGPAKTTPRRIFGPKHWAEPLKWNRDAEEEGVRRRVFCSSMGDSFEDHPTVIGELAKLWPLIRATPWLDWQLLTKRPERIAESLPDDWGNGYPNVWLGTSIGIASTIDRTEHLRAVPAVVHFLSCEPLISGLPGLDLTDIEWVILGFESGVSARAGDINWIREIGRACRSRGIPVFVKQLGAVPVMSEAEWKSDEPSRLLSARNRHRALPGTVPLKLNSAKGGEWEEWPEDLRVREFPEPEVSR